MSITTFKQPEWPFQDAGDICLSCKPIWDHHQPPLPPKHMVYVYQNHGMVMRTDQKKIKIVVCPWCDGDTILRLRKL